MATISVRIHSIYISSGHDFKGHHGGPRGNHPVNSLEEASLKTGQGIEGDRYFGHAENFKGQATFFDWSVFQQVRERFDLPQMNPANFRRNILIQGVHLNSLIGKRFELSGILFEGSEECSPCYWMDEAVAPGLEDFLVHRGGLRVRILSGGILRTGLTKLRVQDSEN